MIKAGYVIPLSALLQEAGLPARIGEGSLQLTRDQLFNLIRKLLASIPVDEAWYKATYPDVGEAIDAGEIGSAKEHFISSGYFEGRRPAKVTVDAEFYLARYPDVAEGVEFNEIASAQEHFDSHGFAEGRLPFEM
jgi:hypothetical protein